MFKETLYRILAIFVGMLVYLCISLLAPLIVFSIAGFAQWNFNLDLSTWNDYARFILAVTTLFGFFTTPILISMFITE